MAAALAHVHTPSARARAAAYAATPSRWGVAQTSPHLRRGVLLVRARCQILVQPGREVVHRHRALATRLHVDGHDAVAQAPHERLERLVRLAYEEGHVVVAHSLEEDEVRLGHLAVHRHVLAWDAQR